MAPHSGTLQGRRARLAGRPSLAPLRSQQTNTPSRDELRLAFVPTTLWISLVVSRAANPNRETQTSFTKTSNHSKTVTNHAGHQTPPDRPHSNCHRSSLHKFHHSGTKQPSLFVRLPDFTFNPKAPPITISSFPAGYSFTRSENNSTDLPLHQPPASSPLDQNWSPSKFSLRPPCNHLDTTIKIIIAVIGTILQSTTFISNWNTGRKCSLVHP